MSNLPLSPSEATKLVLKNLSHPRMRDVLERRFGLKGGEAQTLDAIGRKYKITRERVRQIEADALRHLRKDETLEVIRPVLGALETHLVSHGGVMAEHHFLDSLAESRQHPHLMLILEAGKKFMRIPETGEFHTRWALSREAADRQEAVAAGTVRTLGEVSRPVSEQELFKIFSRHAGESAADAGGEEGQKILSSYLNSSKSIRKNPYGEYGLVSWADVTPRGVRDKAYMALKKTGKAMHFVEVADAISKAGWSRRKAHPQTVHNELIKDKRFVLVGRGMYALREWGYEPGVVRDVLVSLMKKAGKALSRDEIIKMVLEKRMVKPQTIALNLQNKSLFRRTDEGKFMLA